MYEIKHAAGAPPAHAALPWLRQARNLPDLFERAACTFQASGHADYALLYLVVSPEEAIEIAYSGTPPARSRDVAWNGARSPQQAPWAHLDASEILVIEQNGQPFALVLLGPRQGKPPASREALRHLCQATGEILAQALLKTHAMAADFQERRARHHHRQAKSLGKRLRQVSHDLRNHLVPMLYATEELQELLSAPDARRLLIQLERQIQLADQLSKQNLAMFPRRTPPHRCELLTAARELGESWQFAFSRRQQTFELSLPEEAIWVAAEPCELHQILGNLLSNAHKYTAPGGRIRLAIALQDSGCLIDVNDSGRGIGPVVRRRLFEAGVREDPGIEGHGLGLASVRDLLERLGGSVTVTTQAGRGSSFQVRLPVANPPDA